MAELERGGAPAPDARPRRHQLPLRQAELLPPPPASPARHAPSAAESEAPNSATRRRRAQGARSPSPPAAARAAPSTAADVSARAQARKALGRYTARECTLLCETILSQLKRQATAPGVLEDALSPAHIPWEKVAADMRQEHRMALSGRDAQELWKFLAYGEQPAATCTGGEGDDSELLAASDSEEFGRSAQSVTARRAQARAAAGAPAAAAASTGVKTAAVGPAAPRLRLYPGYELPLGLPGNWQKPFNVKGALPLTFVAEKFLKDKGGAPPALLAATGGGTVTPTLAAVSPATSGTAAATAGGAPVVPEKKRGRKPGPKPKTLADVEAAKKQRVAQPKPPPPAVAVVGTPRSAYAPLPTPPPTQPVLPRSAFQFFCRMYELNPKIVEAPAAAMVGATPTPTPVAGAEAKVPTASTSTPPATPAKKTYSELQALFSGAPLYVRSQCQKYALEDLDRYNHECIRRRIWEKAMASQRSSPAAAATPSPVAASAAATKPRATPVASVATPQPQPATVSPVATTQSKTTPVATAVSTPAAAAAAPSAPTQPTNVKGEQ